MRSQEAAKQVPAADFGRMPDFFIVGHPKSGTTALYEMLRGHPQIYMPDVKEPQFFATEERYRFHPEKSLEDYLLLFEPAEVNQRVGEASVFYLWSLTAPSRIAGLRPDAQIIVLLREPASFLRSLHLQLVQGHVEIEKDLRKALALEDVRRQGRHDRHSMACSPQMLLYADYVRYVDQIHRYQDIFSPEQVLVLIYDDFLKDNSDTVRTVLRFLNVDDEVAVATTTANPTVSVRSLRLNSMVKSVYQGHGSTSRAVKTGVKALVPSRRLRRHALMLTHRHILYTAPPPPDEGLMIELRRRFKPEVVALSKFLQRDLVDLWGYDRID